MLLPLEVTTNNHLVVFLKGTEMPNPKPWEKLSESMDAGLGSSDSGKMLTGSSSKEALSDDLLRSVAKDIHKAILGAKLYDEAQGEPDLEQVVQTVKAVASYVFKHREPAMMNSICCRFDEDGDLSFMLCIGGLKGDFG